MEVHKFQLDVPHPLSFSIRAATDAKNAFQAILQDTSKHFTAFFLAKILEYSNFHRKLFRLRLKLTGSSRADRLTLTGYLTDIAAQSVSDKEVERAVLMPSVDFNTLKSTAIDNLTVEHVGRSIPNYRQYVGLAEALVTAFGRMRGPEFSARELSRVFHLAYFEMDKRNLRDFKVITDNPEQVIETGLIYRDGGSSAILRAFERLGKPRIFSHARLQRTWRFAPEVTDETLTAFLVNNSGALANYHPAAWGFLYGLFCVGWPLLFQSTDFHTPVIEINQTVETGFSLVSVCAAVDDLLGNDCLLASAFFATIHAFAFRAPPFFGQLKDLHPKLLMPATSEVERALIGDPNSHALNEDFLRQLVNPRKLVFSGCGVEVDEQLLPTRQAILDFLKENLE